MAINQPLLAELKHEAINTRKLLSRVPTDKFAWQPHEKSMTTARLATHIATIPAWIGRILKTEEFDMSKTPLQIPNAESNEELLKRFDETLSENIAALESASDENLNGNWTFRNGEHVIFNLPRKVALRNMAFNHLIHHRGQLSVFLRLLGIAIPGMYGPSADER